MINGKGSACQAGPFLISMAERQFVRFPHIVCLERRSGLQMCATVNAGVDDLINCMSFVSRNHSS